MDISSIFCRIFYALMEEKVDFVTAGHIGGEMRLTKRKSDPKFANKLVTKLIRAGASGTTFKKAF